MIDAALNKVRPSQLPGAIKVIRGANLTPFIQGPPGTAKSALLRQAADCKGEAFIDFRLSQMAPEDVRGVPMLGEVDGMKGVIWHPPLIFPRDLDYQHTEVIDGRKTIRFFNPVGNNEIHYCTKPEISIISDADVSVEIIERKLDRFTVIVRDDSGNPISAKITWIVTGEVEAIFALEEFNSAPPAVMAACYQLILDRRLGDYVVPNGVMLVALGNRDTDKGVTYKLPKPIANRFVHIELVEHVDDWLDWGGRNGIHPDILGFIAKWSSKLLDFQPESPMHSFATPRSWEFVSKIISQPSQLQDVTRALVCGAIGSAIGTEFLLHRQFMADMPDASSILDGTTTTFRPKNQQHATQIAYSIAVQLLYLLRDRNEAVRSKYPTKELANKSSECKEWYNQADRAIGYMMDHFAPEVNVMAMRMAMLTYGLRFNSEHMPRYVKFTKLNKDLFFG